MSAGQPNNPLHGLTLETILRRMVDRYGWDGLARDLPLACFRVDPSIASALKYLRKAERARKKVEELYVRHMADAEERVVTRRVRAAPPRPGSRTGPTPAPRRR
jgi:uncharacterized protein (DUF2132 family)